MILTTTKQIKRYEALHPLFKKVLVYIKNKNFMALDTGRYEVDGEKLFINNVVTMGVAQDKQPLEMHRAYIDIHIVLAGRERIGYKSTDLIEKYSQTYKKEGDCALSNDAPTSYVDLLPGDACIVFPEDAHAPLIGEGEIRKLVVKIKI